MQLHYHVTRNLDPYLYIVLVATMLPTQAAFQTRHCLYFIMEYASGGDLYSRMENLGAQNKLSDAEAKLYTAEVTIGLDHLHKHGIIHRGNRFLT